MAKKKTASSTQSMLFDVPAIKQEYNEPQSTKKKDAEREYYMDSRSIGLNAVFEGRSKVYDSFTDYIQKISKR